MTSVPDPESLAHVMPGTWLIGASNLVHWLSGERRNPEIVMERRAQRPLALAVTTSFSTAQGKRRSVRSTARWVSDRFVARRSAWAPFAARRWLVRRLDSHADVLVLVHDVRQLAGDGIEVLIRSGTDADGVRAVVAQEWHSFGLRPEDFAKLTWFAL